MFLHSVHGRGDDAAPQKERDQSRQKLLANCGCQNEGTQGLISQSCGQDYSLLDIQCVAPTDFPSRYVCSALPQIRSTAKNTTHSEWQTVWVGSAVAQTGKRASVSPAKHLSVLSTRHLLLLPWQPHQWHCWQMMQSSFLLQSPIPSQISQTFVLKEAEVIPKIQYVLT